MQKITYMQQHIGKDYKTKMKESMSEAKTEFGINTSEAEQNKAVYLKKKAARQSTEAPSQFLFNFQHPSGIQETQEKLSKVDLNKK